MRPFNRPFQPRKPLLARFDDPALLVCAALVLAVVTLSIRIIAAL